MPLPNNHPLVICLRGIVTRGRLKGVFVHYYKFNISDWQAGTRHLSVEEEAVYLRLINHYYDSEKPIPLETQPVIRRLMLGSHESTVCAILEEFFVKTDRGYEKEKCNELIKEYKKTANKNKKNGALGGRPRNNAASAITQSVTSGMPDETQTEPTGNLNQELKTKNQQLETKKQDTEKQRLPFSEIQNAWNEILGDDLGKIRALTDERKKHIKARVNESPKLIDHSKWVEYFSYISQIDFLMGRGQVNPGTGKPFKANLDWVINQSNMNKILEGKYE